MITLTSQLLQKISDKAQTEFKTKANYGLDPDEFVTYCWAKAVVVVLRLADVNYVKREFDVDPE